MFLPFVRMKVSSFVAHFACTAIVSAQVPAYQQCGGGNIALTSCVGGYYCSSQNPYYFQCVSNLPLMSLYCLHKLFTG